jgi:hypothetical protein
MHDVPLHVTPPPLGADGHVTQAPLQFVSPDGHVTTHDVPLHLAVPPLGPEQVAQTPSQSMSPPGHDCTHDPLVQLTLPPLGAVHGVQLAPHALVVLGQFAQAAPEQ